VHFLCLEPRETDKNVLKFTKNLVLKFHLLLLGALKTEREQNINCSQLFTNFFFSVFLLVMTVGTEAGVIAHSQR